MDDDSVITSPKPQSGDIDPFIEQIKKDSRRAVRAVSDWIKEAKEDFRFALGDQWTPEERAILQEQRRPALTINKTKVQVKVISGHQRTNASRIRASAEGTEDKQFAEAIDKAMSYINKTGKLDFKLNQAFDDGVICGRGEIELYLDYDEDPLHGDIKFRSLGPFQVFKDPDAMEYDGADGMFKCKIIRYSKAKLKELYPKKKAVIDALPNETGTDDVLAEADIKEVEDANNYRNEPSRGGVRQAYTADPADDDTGRGNRHTLIEYWYKKPVDRWFIYDIDTRRVAKFDSEEEATARLDELKKVYGPQVDPLLGQVPEGAPPLDQETFDTLNKIKPIKRSLPEMHVAAVVGSELLQNEISPLEPNYNGFPFFSFLAEWYASAENECLRTQGIVRTLKDPQREINKSRSQFLHIVNTAANSGWIGDSDAMSPNEWDDLKRFGSKPGMIIKKTPGSSLERMPPVPPPISQQIGEKMSSENMKEVTGINADLLAVEDKTASGRALAQRIKQALTIVSGIFENWKETKESIGKAVFKLLPEVMDAKKLERVVGPAFMMANQVSPGMLGSFLALIADGRYDVAISDEDSPTSRSETFQQLIEMAQAGLQIPPAVFLKWSSMPNSAEVAQEIQMYQQQQLAAAQATAAQAAAQKGAVNGSNNS